MRQQVRTLTLCFAAVLAFAAFGGASAAYAKEKLPAWGKCEAAATHEGHYGDPNCVVPAKKVFGNYNGGYEWTPLVEATGGHDNGATLKFTGRIEVEQTPVSIELASGYKITCGNGLAPETEIPLGDSTSAKAPLWNWGGCINSEGHECTTAGAATAAEINDENYFFKGYRKEPGSWTGKPEFISGKRGPTPTVGEVYQIEPGGVFFGQIVCEGEAVHAFTIGGEKRGEQLTTQITPVNTMTKSYTATLAQSAGVQGPAALEGHATKPLYAEVNGNLRETVGIEGTMVFPEVNTENPNPGAEEVELKATP